jgi:hypothetical protein
MAYELVHGPTVACPCGKGKVERSRTEHDTYPSRHPDRWNVTIQCSECSARYVAKSGPVDTWYYVPVEQTAQWDWLRPEETGGTKIPTKPEIAN